MSAISAITTPTKKLSMSALIMTSFFALGVNVVWLSYNIYILPVQVEAVTTEATKGIVLGVLVGVAIGIAVIVNIIAGILSDHSNSRYGRRRPTLLIGMLLTLPFLLLPIFMPLSLLSVCIAYFGMQFFTNVASGAWQPTLADFVPVNQRGLSAGIKGVFTLIGSAIGVGGVTALFAIHLANMGYLLVAVVFAAATLINVIAMRRYDKPMLEATPIGLKAALREMFQIERGPSTSIFFWFVIGSFLIYMGVSGFQFFGVYYLEGIIHITAPDALATAIQISGLIGLVIGVIFALAAGTLSDKFGRRNIIILSVIIASAVGLLFPFATTFLIFVIFSAFYSASNGVILSVDTALSSDLVPIEEAGKYMAYANLATGVANGVAPPIFGIILNFQGAPTLTSFIIFFVVSALFFVASCIVMALKVPNV